jgi:flagellar protein FliS
MFGSPHRGAVAYANVELEIGVMSASPHKLVVLLFEGAMLQVTMAKQHMNAGHIAKKGKAISRAIAFIETGLRASLNKNVGGELALNLDALYAYLSKQLVTANTTNSLENLDEVYQLLSELKGAWEAIGTDFSKQIPSAQSSEPVINADPLAPRRSSLVKA